MKFDFAKFNKPSIDSSQIHEKKLGETKHFSHLKSDIIHDKIDAMFSEEQSLSTKK